MCPPTGPAISRSQPAELEVDRPDQPFKVTMLPPTRLIVFIRAPQPGQVKTRLAAEIGADEACRAYRHLLSRLMPTLRSSNFSVELRHTPDSAAGELTPWITSGWDLAPQGEGDLGERLERAVRQSTRAGFTRTLIIGTDCPYLTSADLVDAGNALSANDIVIGPAEDGGYWLIGTCKHHAHLFQDIPWSTDEVLATTLARGQGAGLKIGILRTLPDVDTVDDWHRFLAS